MLHMRDYPRHEACPQEWRGTPDMTGSFELDAAIHRNPNKDIPHRLAYYLENETAYGARTGYDAYHNYGGDS